MYAYVSPDQQKAAYLGSFFPLALCFCHPPRQHTSHSPLTWLEDEDFFLSALESFLLSALQSLLSLAKEAPSKLDFVLREENPGSL